jgi:hypothetical protein
MKKYILLAITISFLSSCGKSGTPHGQESFSDFAYESSDTELSEAASMVDVAVSLSDVDNCRKIEESTVTYDSSLKTAFTDILTGTQSVENMKQRLENMARIKGAELGADRIRFVGKYEASMLTEPTQRVAYYTCKK